MLQTPTGINLPWWTEQILVDETENRRFYVTKGLGAGGTYGLALIHFLWCCYNHESRFSWSIAPTFQQVQDTLIPTFAEVLQNVFELVEGSDYEIVASGRPRILLKKQKQEIHFKSANRADRFVGPSISHYTMTEPGLYRDPQAFEKSSARLRCPKAKRLQSLWEGTPEGLGNTWEREANFPEGLSEARNARRIILWTEHNPVLKPSYVANLRATYNYDKAKLLSYTRGQFVAFTKGTAYWEFVESRNVKGGIAASEYLPLMFCWDFNLSPIAWVVLQRQPFEIRGVRRHRFVAIAESSGKSRGILEACGEFIAKFPPYLWGKQRVDVYGDPSGFAGSHLTASCSYDQIYQNLASRYENVSIQAARKAPSVRDRLERVNGLLAYQQYVVTPECPNLIRSHTTTSLKNGTWDLEKPQGDNWTHWADATGYPLFQLTKAEDLETPVTRILGTNA